MNRSPDGLMVYLPATAQVETNVTALALISPAPDAGWRPRFARMTCVHIRCQLSMQRSRLASASKAAPRSASPEH
jgi:hypothetical protein